MSLDTIRPSVDTDRVDIDRRWFQVQDRVERTHWWYRGRRRLLERLLPSLVRDRANPRILDLGTGCGVNAGAAPWGSKRRTNTVLTEP